VFYSRLTKWDQEFDNLIVHPIRTQLYFPLGLGSIQTPLANGFVVDITETLAAKLDAIRAYKTQFPPEKDRVFRLVEGQAKLYGAAAGFQAGEVLLPATTIGVRDLVKLFSD
jgi:LmbE family N-acetylglucosaminyl deacetylase